ncbi:Serine aminopeptidase, S33 [Epsilonproteobacteria bacterium SCGC AD-308-P11]|nr:Serine aminopeptidase, S33 [Epsilonproteobacteria bacterium SCGC AD-308-P11]
MKKLLLILALATSLFSTELTITSEDGFELHGWLEKPVLTKKSAPIILFAHQFGAEHSTWNAIAKEFNSKGYATLNVDLRGHGKSIFQNKKENKIIIDTRMDHIKEALAQSDEKIGFEKIPSDLIAWLELISEDKTIDMKNLYLFGASLGAGSIIALLGEYEAKGLVVLSAGKLAALAEDIDMALATSMTKTLFIASQNDPLGATNRTIKYGKEAILGISLIVYGDGHGTVILPEVKHYIFSFMDNIR